MKKLLFACLLSLLVSSTLQAQDDTKGTLQFGIGGTLIGDSDHNGIMLFAQYRHPLNDHFSITPRISSLIAGSVTYLGEKVAGEEINAQTSGVALDADLNYAPFKKFKNNFYVSADPSGRFLQQTYPRTVSKRRFPDGSTTFEVDQEFYSGYAIGGTVAVNAVATILPKPEYLYRGIPAAL